MKLLKLCLIAVIIAGFAAMAPVRYQGAVIVGIILLINVRLLWGLWGNGR